MFVGIWRLQLSRVHICIQACVYFTYIHMIIHTCLRIYIHTYLLQLICSLVSPFHNNENVGILSVAVVVPFVDLSSCGHETEVDNEYEYKQQVDAHPHGPPRMEAMPHHSPHHGCPPPCCGLPNEDPSPVRNDPFRRIVAGCWEGPPSYNIIYHQSGTVCG